MNGEDIEVGKVYLVSTCSYHYNYMDCNDHCCRKKGNLAWDNATFYDSDFAEVTRKKKWRDGYDNKNNTTWNITSLLLPMQSSCVLTNFKYIREVTLNEIKNLREQLIQCQSITRIYHSPLGNNIDCYVEDICDAGKIQSGHLNFFKNSKVFKDLYNTKKYKTEYKVKGKFCSRKDYQKAINNHVDRY